MFDAEKSAELTKEECAALIEVMELKNKLTDLEMQSVYFRGCYNSVGYLKKQEFYDGLTEKDTNFIIFSFDCKMIYVLRIILL